MSLRTWSSAAVGMSMSFGVLTFGCQSGGVGDPCTPEDEYQPTFAGYSPTEANIESRSFQCETRLCLVNHFQGRVSCPYGQADPATPIASDTRPPCHIPGTSDPANQITVKVNAQLANRQASKTVYCSCRCDGDDPNAKYCKCPSGYTCSELLKNIGLGSKELAGSYCIQNDTAYDPNAGGGVECSFDRKDCGNADGS